MKEIRSTPRSRRQRIHKNDLYQLGDHRLLCADSRDPTNIRRLVGRRRVRLIFSGPPYFNQRSYCRWRTYTSYLEDMRKVIENCATVLGEGGVVAWLIARGSSEHKDHVAYHSLMLEQQALRFQDAIAWVKPGANYSIKRSCHIRLNSIYYPAFKWETVLIYRVAGPPPRMSLSGRDYMAQHHTDVWEIPCVTRQLERYGHPSVNPVEIPRRCMLAYTRRKAVVLDPFAGSGSTLIAAEETGRTCLVLEWKPKFCRIVIHRWEQLTGESARLIEG